MESFDVLDLDYCKVGKNIKRVRKLSKLTQDSLAERAGISKQYLSLLEKGVKKGRLAVYYRIALALDVTVDFLIGDQAPKDSAMNHEAILERVSNYSQEQYEQLLDYMGYVDYKNSKEKI